MKKYTATGLLTLGIISGSLVCGAWAQETGDRTGSGMSARASDDDDTDYGWIGLIGLAGLAGLMRRNRDPHATYTGTPGTTHR